jgi:hypothetical protein
MYLYGRSFELETDDRPLEHITISAMQTRKMETSTPRVWLPRYLPTWAIQSGRSFVPTPERWIRPCSSHDTSSDTESHEIGRNPKRNISRSELQQIKQNLQNNQVHKPARKHISSSLMSSALQINIWMYVLSRKPKLIENNIKWVW